MIKLFIIEDHHIIVSGLKNIFRCKNDRIKIIGSEQDITLSIEKIHYLLPEIIILDLWIKDSDPRNNIRVLKQEFPYIPIVILTCETSPLWQRIMFSEGAMAYLNKGDSKEIIKSTIIHVSEGKTIIPKQFQLDFGYDRALGRATTLSAMEREILKEYCSGFSLKEIALKKGKSVSTLERMLQKIRRKYHARNHAELIKLLFIQKEI